MSVCLGKPGAIAGISGNELAPDIYGSVKFYQINMGCLVVADIFGLPNSNTNIFGFHIHEGESCSGTQFSDTGSHYDPAKKNHPNHAGDLPPLFSCKGKAFLAVCTDRFSVDEILGKTVVIHSDPDDFHTQPAGNAGQKIGCGVITAL